ncbi:AbrB family transcriptional regulator [Bradyrhizobium sp. WBOS4]|nr:AbrB family transcriptional regulator [Bradyrhizobium sp. WBOS8]MDD1586335.1 AbrB family transcriptional regulator [Bradyrhizobium sp. WBOS4]UUO51066.1 AbrB family transcriptional regulator [Bradyrhizobium sp. WBOS04]UUO63434.1 AbrB family transcriptional regulator [Bradyrhizobium sp. WBOS08]
MQVSKWGNSLAVRLPKKLVEKLGLAEGDHVHVTAPDEETIVVSKDKTDESDFLRRLRALQKPRPKDFVWNRDDANAR